MKRFHEAYKYKKLVPFFGAGISMPLYSMNWAGLIRAIVQENEDRITNKEEIEKSLNDFRYQDAISILKKTSSPMISELEIQKKVCYLYAERQKILEREQFSQDNNYVDFLARGFNHYFTFNYDHFFEGICENNVKLLHSRVLGNDAIDTQFLEKYTNLNPIIWHLHGDMNMPEGIVLSEESYQSLYDDVLYTNQLQHLINNFVLLFGGVSFKDMFVQAFFERNKNIFIKNSHYILFSEDENVNEKELQSNFGLNVLRYHSTDGHVLGIRRKLNNIFGNSIDEKETIKAQGYEANIMINNNAKNAPIINGENVYNCFN